MDRMYNGCWKGLSGVVALLVIALAGCTKGDRNANEAPDTQISVKEINLSGDSRLNSTVRLNWFGTDKDGYVVGFEISFDNQNWTYTTLLDSTFSFTIPAGQDTTDVNFYVRAVDNDGLTDPSPAYLAVPLKNTPPSASFDNELGPRDTALMVSTFKWNAADPDGNASIAKVEVKFNQGQWYELAMGQEVVSFLVDPTVQSGAATAEVYFGFNDQPEAEKIDGLLVNGYDTLYIRATDIAGAVSPVDTADAFYLKNKTQGATLLWVSGQVTTTANKYKAILDGVNITYDFLDYGRDINGDAMPSYWDPTFKLISRQYPKMFVSSGQETYRNRVTSRDVTMLEFMAPVIQSFTNNGGKSFVTVSFNKAKDLSEISGPYPVKELVTSTAGQARILPDSGLVPLMMGPYPIIKTPTNNLQTGVVPIVGTDDSEDFYRARLTKLQGWQGTDVVGVIRRPNNVWSQVFFGVELHNYNGDPAKLEDLFEEILVNEF